MTTEDYCREILGQLLLRNCALSAEVDRLKAELEEAKKHGQSDAPATQ